MNILFIQHVGLLGGSGRSLYELVRELKTKLDANFIVVSPPGKIQVLFRQLGCEIFTVKGLSNFDNNRYSYYTGVRWLILFREVFLIIPTIILFFRLKRNNKDISIIHINEITMPLVGVLARLFYPNAAIICHARAVQRNNRNIVSRILGCINNWAYNCVICIDKHVESSFPYEIKTVTIHNGLPIPKKSKIRRNINKTFTVGMVGSLNRSKGSHAFLRAAKIIAERNLDVNVKFLVFGAVPRTRKDIIGMLLSALKLKEDLYFESLAYLRDNNLTDFLQFHPYEEDLEKIYDEIDLICFPSLLDAPGRPIFEAGVYGKPAIASISSPKDDTFLPGQVGLIVEPSDQLALANGIEFYVCNPEVYRTHSIRCIEFYQKNFDIKKSANSVVEVYSNYKKIKRL